MSNKRENPRGRNKKNSHMNINTLSIIILVFLIVIAVIIIIGKSIKRHMSIAETPNTTAEIYTLFQELDLESKKLVNSSVPISNESTTDTVINIATIGEILCETNVYDDAYNSETQSYDFSPMFKNVSKYIQNADLAIGLLETNFVSSKSISGKTYYNSPVELAQEMKNIGIDILNTATNHSLDYGYEGICSTIDSLDELGLSHVGTYKTQEEHDNVLIKDVQGIKLAFLSYTYGTYVQASGIVESAYCVNYIDKEKMKNDIQMAREQGADYVFVNVHWGDLTSGTANQTQKELADYLFECGADYILGGHPASLEPMETRENSSGQNVFIAYSTGNFISSKKYTNSELEIILNLEITKVATTGETYLTKVTYTPIYLLDNGKNAENRFELLDMKSEIASYEAGENNISEEMYNKLKTGLTKISTLLGK